MKKFLTILLIGFVCLTLTGCGDKTSGGKDNTGKGEYQGDTTGAASLKNVSEKNYKEVAKNVFGLDLKDNTGWTIKSVASPNKVNNLNIDWTITNGSDAKAILEEVFNNCKSVSKDGIYSQGINESYTAIVKKEKYDDFNTMFDKIATVIGDYYQMSWIYDNNGKSVQFSLSIQDNSASLMLVLMG